MAEDGQTPDDLIELDLPPELQEKFSSELTDIPVVAEAVETPAAAPVVETPVASTPEPEPTPAASSSLFEQAEAARARYREQLAAQPAPVPVVETPPDYNQASDWNAAAKMLTEHVTKGFQRQLTEVVSAQDLRYYNLLEQQFSEKTPDYLKTIERSGVMDDIRTLGADGRRSTPKDPALHAFIFQQVNPAQALYEYAKGRLSKTTEREATERGKDEGRREVVQAITKNVERAPSLARMPSSSGRTQLRPADIARLSDTSKAWLKKNRPEIWNQYLGKPA